MLGISADVYPQQFIDFERNLPRIADRDTIDTVMTHPVGRAVAKLPLELQRVAEPPALWLAGC